MVSTDMVFGKRRWIGDCSYVVLLQFKALLYTPSVARQARADKQSQLRSNRLMTKSSPYIRLRSLNKNGLLMAQFSRYQFILSAKLFTQYISRPFLFKIYGCDLVLNLLDIIGYLSGLCLSARACCDEAYWLQS